MSTDKPPYAIEVVDTHGSMGQRQTTLYLRGVAGILETPSIYRSFTTELLDEVRRQAAKQLLESPEVQAAIAEVQADVRDNIRALVSEMLTRDLLKRVFGGTPL